MVAVHANVDVVDVHYDPFLKSSMYLYKLRLFIFNSAQAQYQCKPVNYYCSLQGQPYMPTEYIVKQFCVLIMTSLYLKSSPCWLHQ